MATAVREVQAVLDEALILAEAEEILAHPRNKNAKLTDEKKTHAIKVLLNDHPDFFNRIWSGDSYAPFREALQLRKRLNTLDNLYPMTWWTPFLAAYAQHGTIRQALFSLPANTCSLRQVMDAKASSPTFMMLYDAADRIALGELEDELKRRALGGSDILLIVALKARAPEKYSERSRVEFVRPGAVKRKAEKLAARLGIDPEELARLAGEIADEDDDDE